MANDNSASAWHELFLGWPLWLKITVELLGIVLFRLVVFGVSFLIINRNKGIYKVDVPPYNPYIP